jgi:hypothetical protein
MGEEITQSVSQNNKMYFLSCEKRVPDFLKSSKICPNSPNPVTTPVRSAI